MRSQEKNRIALSVFDLGYVGRKKTEIGSGDLKVEDNWYRLTDECVEIIRKRLRDGGCSI
tara:strand:+ start:645 stop:824 length:180 start_codon:yes stop_codon:yes gene_type:complete